jgi:hypothetical protein
LGFGSTGPPDLSVMHVGTAAQAVRKSLVEPAKQADGLSRRRVSPVRYSITSRAHKTDCEIINLGSIT